VHPLTTWRGRGEGWRSPRQGRGEDVEVGVEGKVGEDNDLLLLRGGSSTDGDLLLLRGSSSIDDNFLLLRSSSSTDGDLLLLRDSSSIDGDLLLLLRGGSSTDGSSTGVRGAA
jgi:hypothetical protein